MGIYFNCSEDKVGMQSQVHTGEARVGSPHLCSGWWNKLTGQIWFDDQPITLIQKSQGGAIFISELKAIVNGGHTITFQNLKVMSHQTKGFKAAIEDKFTKLWSDNSEQAK